ncbi:TrmH family RNA methyltransferase [uncultured Enterovirga sp.]|uniref:TrmH family RNA methyltransferase n=1 Tax=uncultured Enterovirga sp. TaxID=2026352 RepID=UPI0035C98889
MSVIRIEDPEDPRIAPYRSVRERDLARADGCFIAEGDVVVRILLSGRSRFRAQSLLLADTAAGQAFGAEFGASLPTYAASRAVMDRIVGFPIHRGILAVAGRGDPAEVDAILPPGPARLLVLCGIANHDNVGGAFRNAAAFGADAVLLDGESCDPLYRKAIRVSVGATLIVPFARRGSPEAILGRLTEAGFHILALSPEGREALDAVAWPKRVAIVVGSEGTGLSRAILSARRTIRIGMAPGFDSLNVATASGIALHAAWSGSARPGAPD